MKILDERGNETLYLIQNEIFNTVLLECGDESYVLTDMQGQYPITLDECTEYDWVRAEDLNYI